MRVPDATAAAPEIGPYRCLRKIGAGGMGEVYLAYDQRLERRVAVKHLKREADRSTPRERLRREARAVARLSHPAIVQVFELLESPDGDWIVMEFVDGPSLAETIRRGPLELSEVLSYGAQIAAGLAEAHAKGIVHRDLKAENVMIAPSGRAKILDFGLARDLEAASHDPTLSRTGAVLGTVRTMAPEQARGLKAGPRADLFSLGVLLYEMLTGRSPFQGATVAESLHRLLGQPPKPLPEETPAELRKLVDQLLEKAPELRPASSEAVASRLLKLSSEVGSDPAGVAIGENEDTELSSFRTAETWPKGATRTLESGSGGSGTDGGRRSRFQGVRRPVTTDFRSGVDPAVAVRDGSRGAPGTGAPGPRALRSAGSHGRCDRVLSKGDRESAEFRASPRGPGSRLLAQAQPRQR